MSINLTDELLAKTKKGKIASAKQVFLEGDKENLQQISEKTHQLEDAIKDISVSGGASTATAVSYNNETSGMTAVTAQGAIDELVTKNKHQDAEITKKANSADVNSKMQTEQTRVNGELAKKFNSTNITQESGESEDKVMSQNAVSTKLSNLSIAVSINNAPIQATINRYINANGVISEGSASNKNYCTDYIPVSQGEKYIYHGKYAKGVFKAVWGYSDSQGNNPVELVDFTGEEQTTEFTIDNKQVKYIAAWGNTDTEVWVGKEGVWSKTETQGRKIEELNKKVESIPSKQITENKEAIEILGSKLDGQKIQTTFKGYIDTQGKYQSQANNLCTDYISVMQDDKFIYHGKYAKGIFKAVWGYSDNQGSNPIALVDFTGEEQTTEFSINNEQVKYIRAWGDSDFDVWVAREGLNKQVENNTNDISFLKDKVKYGLMIVVDANGKGDYTSLQEAIYKANDSADTHITILVMPGIYVMDEYDSTKRHFANKRNLSIIGLDKNTCIVRNDNGNYTTNPYIDNAPLKLSGKVLVSNLTIISTDEQNNTGNGVAYCVHVDSDANEGDIMEIRDCILYNNHGACIGIGLRQGFTLKIVGCEVKSDLKSDDLTQTWQGAIICHDQLKSDVTNENLFIKDCLVESNSEVCIVVNSATYKNSIDLIAIGNTIVSTNSTRALTVNSPNTKNIRTGNNNIVQK